MKQGSLFLGLALAILTGVVNAEDIPLIDDLRYVPGPGPSVLRIEFQNRNAPVFKVEENKATNQIILYLQGSQIPASLARPLDVSSVAGPIQKIIPFNVGGKEILSKVIMQLRAPATYRVVDSGVPGQYELQFIAQTATALNRPLNERRREGTRSWMETDFIQKSSAAEDKSAKIAKELIETLDARDESKVYKGKKITIEASDISVHDIFRLIGAASGLNIYTSDDIQGNIKALSFRDVPWDQVLDLVLRSKSLKAVASGNVVRIVTLDAYKKEQDAQKQIKLMELKLAPVMMAIIPLSFAKAEEVKPLIEALLTDKQKQQIATAQQQGIQLTIDESGEAFIRGRIEVDKRTNSLIITHSAIEIERIKKFVHEIDVAIPQVLIEAKFVEASETFNKVMAVHWSAFNSSGQNGLSRQTGIASGGVSSNTTVPTLAVSDATIAPDTGRRGFAFGTILSRGLDNLGINLELQELDANTKIIASPRVIVNNNTQAFFRDGKTIQRNAGSTASATGGSVVTTTTVENVDAFLDLTVTPQIAGTGKIVLKLDIKNDVPSSDNTTINKKVITTSVMIDSGSTLVLGGVYSYSLIDISGGIPFLKDLPILGPLFRRDTNQYEKRELIVFMTPRILGEDGSMLGEINSSVQQ